MKTCKYLEIVCDIEFKGSNIGTCHYECSVTHKPINQNECDNCGDAIWET